MNRTVGINLDNKLLVVSLLFNPVILNGILNIANGGVNGVDGDNAEFSILRFILLGRYVSTSFTNVNIYFDFNIWLHSADYQLRV